MTGNSFAFFATVLVAMAGVVRAEWENPADRYADAWREHAEASCPLPDDGIRHFVYFARDREALRGHALLSHPRFRGAQIMYAWGQLEPERDRYDFAAIRSDREYLAEHGKQLFVQLQDATFFNGFRGVPDYLASPEFDGGLIQQHDDDGRAQGWVAKRWNPAVRQRYAKLLQALGAEFDGLVEGVNLQESAIGVSREDDPTFTPAGYAAALRDNMRALKSAFPVSVSLQYANFMPGEWLPWEDKGYLRSLYAHGEEIGVGLGAPDLMVRRQGHLNHALALMHEATYSVPLGIAIQDGNYIEQTGSDEVITNRKNLVPMLHAFARDFLRVQYMFWVNQAPYFEEDVLSCFRPVSAHSAPPPG